MEYRDIGGEVYAHVGRQVGMPKSQRLINAGWHSADMGGREGDWYCLPDLELFDNMSKGDQVSALKAMLARENRQGVERSEQEVQLAWNRLGILSLPETKVRRPSAAMQALRAIVDSWAANDVDRFKGAMAMARKAIGA